MAKHRPTPELPPCYALVVPGLEPIAADEIRARLGGDVRRTERGTVVFRVPEIDGSVLRLRTAEDVFLFAWGTDQLSYRSDAPEQIRRWTRHEVDWPNLLRLHHAVRPRGKPTFRLVTQMTGEHGFQRRDAGRALAEGLAGKFPPGWRQVEENATVEVWLTIHGATAVCGVRLSDRTMRHRTYKTEHLPASLRPTVAAAMVRLAEVEAGQTVLDPMCGAGTILGEALYVTRPRVRKRGRDSFPQESRPLFRTRKRGEEAEEEVPRVWGGDIDLNTLHAARSNLWRLGPVFLARWDARRLPLPDACVDRIVSNPPFGKQLGRPEEIGPLYRSMAREYDRVLRPGGRAVLLVGDLTPLRDATRPLAWSPVRQVRARVLGQEAFLTVWRKGG
jgi:23S rRNA G2445 N2-methylase RlmL